MDTIRHDSYMILFTYLFDYYMIHTIGYAIPG